MKCKITGKAIGGMYVSVDWITGMNARQLSKLPDDLFFDDNGKYISAIKVYNAAMEAKEKGYKVISREHCINFDKEGYSKCSECENLIIDKDIENCIKNEKKSEEEIIEIEKGGRNENF